jgi:hypothetical protein
MMEGSNSSNAARRVRVLPGSTLSLSNPPPPPSQPPPQPVHLCKIAVIGNPNSGKSSLVNKFLTRKSASAAVNNININGGGDNSSAVGGANDMTVQWCNASATSNGTFGSTLGASLIGPIGSNNSGGGASEHTATLAEYYKKDISLKRGGRRSRRNEQQQQEDQTSTTTCVRAQVWDVNVPIQQPQPHFNSDDSNNNHKNDLNNSPDYIKATSSITSQQINNNNNNNNGTNSLLAPLLPLLKRINGIIIACQCPLPPTTTTTKSSLLYSSNASQTSYNSQSTRGTIRSSRGEMYWEELDALEGQIATWIQFVRGDCNDVCLNGAGVKNDGNSNKYNNDSNNDRNNRSNSNNHSTNHQNTIIIILTYADIAITEYSPKEWMKLSIKMEEICQKFGIHSWRMGTCVSSSSGDGSGGGYNNAANDHGRNVKEEEMNNNSISISKSQQQQQQQQQIQHGLFERMAIQQQRLLEDMEDSVEGTFIDMILLHLDK